MEGKLMSLSLDDFIVFGIEEAEAKNDHASLIYPFAGRRERFNEYLIGIFENSREIQNKDPYYAALAIFFDREAKHRRVLLPLLDGRIRLSPDVSIEDLTRYDRVRKSYIWLVAHNLREF